MPLQARRVQIAHVRIVSTSRFRDASVTVTVESVSTDTLVRDVHKCANGIDVAVVGNVARVSFWHTLRDTIASVAFVTMTVVQVQFSIVETGGVLSTRRTVT